MLDPVVRQRRRLEAILAALDEEDWGRASRCEGWTIQDVVAHLAGVTSFWQGSVEAGLRGSPTRILAAFDPAATPPMMVDVMRTMTPAEVLELFVSSNDGYLDAITVLDDAGWSTVAEAPPGHVTIRRLSEHALWDSWVHERDIVLPLGGTPVVEPDEVLTSLRYADRAEPGAHVRRGRSGHGRVLDRDDRSRVVLRARGGRVRRGAGGTARTVPRACAARRSTCSRP